MSEIFKTSWKQHDRTAHNFDLGALITFGERLPNDAINGLKT